MGVFSPDGRSVISFWRGRVRLSLIFRKKVASCVNAARFGDGMFVVLHLKEHVSDMLGKHVVLLPCLSRDLELIA